MYETPAKILSSAYIGLGRPEPELLQQNELAEVMYRKLNYYYEGARQSDQNLNAKKTDEFSLDAGSCTYNLTENAGDAVVPLWCERKLFDYVGNNPVWQFVPTVNMDTSAERREEMIIAVSYYGEQPNQIIASFSIYGDEMVMPYNKFRIWYAPLSTFSANINEAIQMPANLTALVTIDTIIGAIPQIILNASKYLDKRPELAARVEALKLLLASAQLEKAEWLEWWQNWRKMSRSAHRAINHNDVLATSPQSKRYGGGFGRY